MSDRDSNRLAKETSPYLLQHRHNPVDWYPWGEEALRAAATTDRPIFLSIGYAACHWCHVMERESFEDASIAAVLNEKFVAIKVDREERPDLDEIYMQSIQLLTGQGGWPMSVFLTPDGRPFFGGTYFPPEDRWGRPGFRSVLRQLAQAWETRREQVEETADQLAHALREGLGTVRGEPGAPGADMLRRAVTHYEHRFDAKWGGFSGAPKFPHGDAISLLLQQAAAQKRPEIGEMALQTLDAMDRGGIHDQIGGGFHRYSTDAQWLVPHFEKMLYDQALLGQSYLDAWKHTDDQRWLSPLRGICEWVLRDMVDERGGFHSTLDADSEGEEGRFYVWEPQQVRASLLSGGLSGDEADRVLRWYGLDGPANFEGSWILHRPTEMDSFCAGEKVEADDWRTTLRNAGEILRAEREKREWPGRDDKVLAAWNGLMIGVLARAGAELGETRWVRSAERAARFVLEEMRQGGRLMRAWRNGKTRNTAFLEDYAFLARGVLDLHEATGETGWLEEARGLVDEAIRLFHDDEAGGFFFTGADAEQLLLRSKAVYDGATPAGTSVLCLALLRLGDHLDEPEYRELARDTLRLYRGPMEQFPGGFATLLQAVALLTESAGRATGEQASQPASTGRPQTLHLEVHSAGEIKRGGACDVRLTLRFAQGWYAARDATNLEVSPAAEGWTLEEIVWPSRSRTDDDAGDVYEGDIGVIAKLRAPEDIESGDWEIPVVVSTELCGGGQCHPRSETVAPLRIHVHGSRGK